MPISTTYTIYNTQGSLSFQLSAGRSNGPNELTQTTDLTYYGYGTIGWGQQVDQNFYSLLENFACVQSSGSPATPSNGLLLGDNRGINYPITGQQWFNLTNKEMYVYAGASEPVLWRHILSEQYADTRYLSISGDNSGVLLDGSNTPMTGPLLLVGDPTFMSDARQAATKQYVDTAIAGASTGNYVSKLGDTMTGELVLTTSSANDAFATVHIVGANTYPELQMGRLNGLSTQSVLSFFTSGSLTSGPTIDSAITASGGIVGSPGNGNITITGFLMTDGRAISKANQVTTKTYVDSAITAAIASLSGSSGSTYVKKIGDSMTGQLSMGNNRITNVGSPVNSADATNLSWVKAHAYMPSGQGATYQVWVSPDAPTGGNPGDIWIRY